MNDHPLSIIQIWVLIVLGSGPCHEYGLEGRVHGASLSYVSPHRDTLRGALKVLLGRGLIEVVGYEDGSASPHKRKLYRITPAGLRVLWRERTGLTMAAQGIDRALAQSIIEQRGVAQVALRH
jgi:DNA-binding PadR family transcriptional regulator